jgi:predicted AAA+ superfamily ATPase
MFKQRYLYPSIVKDLREKMVFLGGPRQVGKTTLSKHIGKEAYVARYAYLNWDNREDKKAILEGERESGAKLFVFDEIHKYRQWKNYIKGEYDKYKTEFDILVTGSARLDVYRRGGDSLMGRYHYFRLHPFSVAEVVSLSEKNTSVRPRPGKEIAFPVASLIQRKAFEDLLTFGGFPEPFLKKDPLVLRRFHNERLTRLVREDIRDVEQMRDLSALEVLVEVLPSKVGSLLSLNTLREDFSVAHKTMSLWMDVLERFYYQYRIRPFTDKTFRSLRKEPKMYLWDWSQVENEGARLENLVASHLLKLTHFLYDAEGYRAELFFLRDREGREVDFVVVIDKKPWFVVEVKSSEQKVSKHLPYFIKKLNIPFAYQLVSEKGIDFRQNGIRVMSVDTFLAGLV